MRFPDGSFLRPIAVLVALGAGLCSPRGISHAQDGLDPMDIWYRGFLLVQSAQEFEKNGKYLEALNKLTEAKPFYDHLAQDFPDFQPEIVKERRHLIAEKRDDMKQRMRPSDTPKPPASQPSSPGSGGIAIAPPQLPGYGARSREMEVEEADGEVALPSWDEGASQALPRIASAPGMPQVETGRPASVGAIANSLREDLAKKDSLIEWLNQKNQDLNRKLSERESELRRARNDLDMAQANQATILRDKRELEARGGETAKAEIEKLKSLLNDATTMLQDALDRNDDLVTELATSKTEMKKLRGRMAELERERDNLLEVVRGEGNGGKALKELMDRNRTLTEQLDRAEQLASSLSELSKEKDGDIALLKSEITKIKLERDNLLSENMRHQQSIEDLQRKLELLSDGITAEEKNALAQASPVERQENQLLRSIVLKQLRRQAQMKEAKSLLLRQLDKVGSRSETLLGLIDDMARGSQLTEEEKALFKSPQFQEIVDAASADASEPPQEREDAGKDGGSLPSMTATLIAAASGSADEETVANQTVAVELSQIDKAARLDFKEGRLSEAEAGFLEYLRYRPQSVSCLCNLGVLKIAMKNYSEAEYYLDKAVAMDSASGLAHYLLGRTYFLQDKLDDALAKLEEGLTHDSQNAKAHNCVGVISTRKGWVERAQRAFSNAVSIDPEYGDAHFNLAVLYATRDQPDAKAAGKHYFKALHLGLPRDATIEEFLEESELKGLSIGLR
ncbi:MAG: tetratricopeptide repeat protein [Verrucomicrobiales bacterium]